ncbi:hypothetical protein [Xanthobacter oligotrophicus]|uniref:hypothetical protein n=1 Tax=Xanthobacter oligotrophicus TaxID=2607286 RepID=UPI0011F0C932|nr:hypothetical protein [Xanthobacter oligotrophicus]
MKLQACQNCWFNGLQYGSVGLSFGYCSRHRKVLNIADETTCGQHIRKDLGLARAQEVAAVHAKVYDEDKIVRITDNCEIGGDVSASGKDIKILRGDAVAGAVLDYGFLNSKIASFAQLKSMATIRSDVAMASLGRAYVKNCVSRGGKWTSGIHIYWWTKKRIAHIPELMVRDLRYSESIQISRQAELAVWSVMMLRLSLLDDIVGYARQQNDEVGDEGGITNRAANEVQVFNLRKLSKWILKELLPALDSRLDDKRYNELASELRREEIAVGEAD